MEPSCSGEGVYRVSEPAWCGLGPSGASLYLQVSQPVSVPECSAGKTPHTPPVGSSHKRCPHTQHLCVQARVLLVTVASQEQLLRV